MILRIRHWLILMCQLYDYGEGSSITCRTVIIIKLYSYPDIGPYDYGDIDNTYVNFSNSGYYHIDQFYGPIVADSGTLEPVFSDYNPC